MFLGKYVSPWFDEYEEDVLAKHNMDFRLLFRPQESSSIVSISSPKRDSINSRQVVKIIKSTKEKKDIGMKKRGEPFFKMTNQNQQQNNLSSALNDPELSIS